VAIVMNQEPPRSSLLLQNTVAASFPAWLLVHCREVVSPQDFTQAAYYLHAMKYICINAIVQDAAMLSVVHARMSLLTTFMSGRAEGCSFQH